VRHREITRVRRGVVGGTRVSNPVGDGGLVQCHGAERVGEGLLIPAPSPRWSRWLLSHQLHEPRVDRKWRQRWHRGRPDLLRLIAEGGCDSHHGLGLAWSLLAETLVTWPHLNRANPGVEEGRPRCVCTLILVGAAIATTTTAITATAPVATAVTTVAVVVVVVVVLTGLLWQALLLLLLSGGHIGPPEEVGADGGLGVV
jgi:hypothetical protein